MFFKFFMESQKISHFLKEKGHLEDREEVRKNPIVKDWLSRIGQKHPLPYKTGKASLWLRGNNYYPVKIANVQDLTVALKRTDGEDWSELHNLWPIFNDPGKNQEIIIPKTKAILVDTREYMRFLDWLTFIYVKNRPSDPNEFFENLLNKYGSSLDKIFSQKGSELTTTDFDINSLKDIERDEEKRDAKASRGNKPGGTGRTILEFPNGWKWLSLDRASCAAEGDAAGHCGNGNPLPGENILSLRDQDNHIHMTVVVRNGTTSEMKAPGNRKPKPYTHPYVVALIKKLKLKIGHGKWMPENDFKFTDLKPELAYELYQELPELTPSYNIQFIALKSQGNQAKFQELMREKYGMPFPYYYDYADQAILLDQGNLDNIAQHYQIKNTDGKILTHQNIFTEDDRPSVVITMFANAWNDIRADIREAIKRAYKITGDIEETMKTLWKNDNNFKKVVSNLYKEVEREMQMSAFNSAARNNSYDGFYVKLLQDQLKVLLHPKDAEDLLNQKEKIEIPLGMEFDVSGPVNYYYGDVTNKQKWELALIHALDKTRFWERPILNVKGQNWRQEVEDIPNLKDRERAERQMPKLGEHPMQKQVRMEYIRRELDNKMMYGGYDEFIQELKKKGWWGEFVDWLRKQGLASGYGF